MKTSFNFFGFYHAINQIQLTGVLLHPHLFVCARGVPYRETTKKDLSRKASLDGMKHHQRAECAQKYKLKTADPQPPTEQLRKAFTRTGRSSAAGTLNAART